MVLVVMLVVVLLAVLLMLTRPSPQRVMKGGRSFEYVSGEDPILGSKIVVPIVGGIQKNVMSISKVRAHDALCARCCSCCC